MTDPVPPVPVASARRSLRDRVSVIWLVPLGALAVALGVAWESYSSQGPLIEIEFDDAAGVEARETVLRYRNVAVGVVEAVRFTADLQRVVVSVRVEPEVAPYIDEDAQFWVVRPEITPQRITGLETVLSGVFIEGSWNTDPGEPQERYHGRNTSPLLRAGEEGLEITLRSADGTLTSPMPLIYKGVTVGEVGQPEVAEDGVAVSAPAVIFAPYDSLVTEATVFWDASGFSLSVGAAGAEVDFDSLSSLIIGGLAFDTFVSGARPAVDGDVFEAYLYEADARESIYTDPNSPILSFIAIFTGDVAGLAVGAPVELGGLRVGEVLSVTGLLDPERFGNDEIHLQAVLAIQPARLGLEGEEGRDEVLSILQRQVEEDGLRARLATGSLLGGLKVQLVEEPDAPPAAIDLSALPYPQLPVTQAAITDIAGTAEGLLERVDNLPVEELLDSAVAFLNSAGILVGSEETQAIPGEVNALLGDIRGVTASPEVQALPGQIAGTLAGIETTATGLSAVLADLQEQQAVARLLAAADSADAALRSVDAAAQGVPSLIARLDALAAKAEALEVEPLLAEITLLAADARALVNQPDLQAIPANAALALEEAAGALTQARAILAEVNGAELGPRLAATLDSARRAALSIESAAQGAPALVERLTAVAAKAETLEIEPLLAELAGLSADARALVAQPGLQALPNRVGLAAEEAAAALGEARAILEEANAADLTGRLAAALASAQTAAASIEDAAQGAPELVDRLNAVAAKVQALAIEPLLEEVTGTAAEARALLGQPGMQELPARLVTLADDASLVLRDARTILGQLEEGDLGTRLATAIQSAEEAATAIRDAAQRLPDIATRIDALVAKAEGLPVEDLVAELTSLATSANALVSSEATQALPADLSAALAEVEAILLQIREGGVVENINATLASARAAADTLPGLVERAGGLLDSAGTTLDGLAASGGIVAEAQAAIREVARAAEAVAELARTIERDPNALIFGRD